MKLVRLMQFHRKVTFNHSLVGTKKFIYMKIGFNEYLWFYAGDCGMAQKVIEEDNARANSPLTFFCIREYTPYTDTEFSMCGCR